MRRSAGPVLLLAITRELPRAANVAKINIENNKFG